MNEEILEKVEIVISPILENLGYKLIERELIFDQGRQVLRLYIDRESGTVNIDDCETASHAVEDVLEAENIIKSAYRLEVSSPGLDRPLKSQRDFEIHCGKVVRFKTREPIEGRSNYKGTLREIKNGIVFIFIDNKVYEVPFDLIMKARLVPEVKEAKAKFKN